MQADPGSGQGEAHLFVWPVFWTVEMVGQLRLDVPSDPRLIGRSLYVQGFKFGARASDLHPTNTVDLRVLP
jgi:hypothetical protein